MSSNSFGEIFRLTSYGASHGKAIGEIKKLVTDYRKQSVAESKKA